MYAQPKVEQETVSARIVSVTPMVPFDGVPHAGGQYYLRHLRALAALGHRITILAPDSPDNRVGRLALRNEFRVELLAVSTPLGRRLADFSDKQQARLFPVRPVARIRRAFSASTVARRLVETADVVEYQWTETAWLAAHLPAPSARHVVVVHDVLSQSYERFFEASAAAPLPQRLLARWRRFIVARDERRVYSKADVAVTFSAKDVDVIHRCAGAAAPARVVRPPLAGVESAEHADPGTTTAPVVLFVGAFDRSVNADAAEWAATEILPIVRARHPRVRFVFAGANPTPRMHELAADLDAVEVTGRVETLDPYYADAAAVLVPLRSGAGVKFKTVEAMVRGIPVVSTTVGVEGIVDDRLHVFAVADEAEALARGVIAVLDDPAAARADARGVRAAARAEFSAAQFERSLAEVYGS